MRLRFALLIAVVAVLSPGAMAAEFGAHAAEPAPSGHASDHMAGWLENAVDQIEAEAASDVAASSRIPAAVDREWRSFDDNGSALGALRGAGWMILVGLAALLAEWGTVRLASRHARRRLASRDGGPSLGCLTMLVLCDIAGLAAFLAVFSLARRHLLPAVGVAGTLTIFAANVLLRWRIASAIIGVVLRPTEPAARLIEISDREARRLGRFLSGTILAVILLIGFVRYGLMDGDSGAAHVVGLFNAAVICALYAWIVLRARHAAEALIRGRRCSGVVAAIRSAIARAWTPTALSLIAGLFLFFVAGLSLGLLSYYRAVTSTLGILFVVLVVDRLIERVCDDGAIAMSTEDDIARLQARTGQRVMRAIGLVAGAMAVVWVWTGAVQMAVPDIGAVMRSTGAAVGTLFVAYVAWELVRLAIDRHLHTHPGPQVPGAASDDDLGTPASRLETILPMLRAAFAVAITVIAVLIVLSRLGVDTAPLIAGAGVFGLALSFGSQSLVRDIISGLFYMWDDAFRVGEYIDTGRLKGTVETLGMRSVKLRHQNGPLHTIPYGQLGAVTNLSRDFATIKFNLRFDPHTDVELVRKTTKQIGVAMQEDNPELAGEIMQPLKLQGIAEVVDNALVLRFKFTARPVKPSWVQREYLKRMYQVFAEKDIAFAKGALFLQTVPLLDSAAAPPPPGVAAPPPPSPAGAAVGAVGAAAALGGAAAIELAELADPVRGA
jgi:moderate conductance mechanosensitive channel